ncbi:MAG: hypothetical protein MI922_07125 [Bacteroidales bacterium]|nr:hypothetical protein [Bacteroidales bacterium]
MIKNIIYIVFSVLVFISCAKNDYDIEYQGDGGNPIAGNWVVFEIPQGEFENWGYEHYELVTAVDPNTSDSVFVIDNLYDSKVRIRLPYGATGRYNNRYNHFNETFVPQIDTLDGYDYGIHFVSLNGEVSRKNYQQQLAYLYAQATFPNKAFDFNDIEDVIVINAGFYDIDKMLVDTVQIVGYRKIGFEDVPIN